MTRRRQDQLLTIGGGWHRLPCKFRVRGWTESSGALELAATGGRQPLHIETNCGQGLWRWDGGSTKMARRGVPGTSATSGWCPRGWWWAPVTVHPYVDILFSHEPGSRAPSSNPSCSPPAHIRIGAHGQGHAVDRIGGLVMTREKVEQIGILL